MKKNYLHECISKICYCKKRHDMTKKTLSHEECLQTCKNTNHLILPCNFKNLIVEVGTSTDVSDDPFVLSVYCDMPRESCTLRNDFLNRIDKLAYEKNPYPKPHLPPNIYN